ncbi:MAG: hypothetical protein ABS918_05260 [Saccharopolyspora rectivirgula]
MGAARARIEQGENAAAAWSQAVAARRTPRSGSGCSCRWPCRCAAAAAGRTPLAKPPCGCARPLPRR